jgi:2-polyprenyl-3-methyl-5-hydroxy-6-metoxy-1,4-benzoquinol methylase
MALKLLEHLQPPPARILDIGCGNGATARFLSNHGYTVTGIDTSSSGVSIARQESPSCRFEVASVYDDNLSERFGRFDAVVSLEVIEHCPDSFAFMHAVHASLNEGGIAVLSTPYHALLKNLLIVLSGRFDSHFDPLWVGGHLKFFSVPALRRLLQATGFEPVTFARVGRLPPLAKSVVVAAKRS